jgi:hypothetical protein
MRGHFTRRHPLASLSSHPLTYPHKFAPEAKKMGAVLLQEVAALVGRLQRATRRMEAGAGVAGRGKGSSQRSTSSVIHSSTATPLAPLVSRQSAAALLAFMPPCLPVVPWSSTCACWIGAAILEQLCVNRGSRPPSSHFLFLESLACFERSGWVARLGLGIVSPIVRPVDLQKKLGA